MFGINRGWVLIYFAKEELNTDGPPYHGCLLPLLRSKRGTHSNEAFPNTIMMLETQTSGQIGSSGACCSDEVASVSHSVSFAAMRASCF